MKLDLSVSDSNQTGIIRLEPILSDVAGQLAPRSRRLYATDARHFADWLAGQGLNLSSLTRSDFIRYRSHLEDSYRKATASRMLVVARRLLDEAVKRGDLLFNPAAEVKGFKVGENETPRRVLTEAEAKELLASIDLATSKGKRDYALIALLLKTGLRRSEATALTLGSLRQEQGHSIAVIEHGKGDKRRIAKIPVAVMRAISDYLEATERKQASSSAPLFCQFDRWDRPIEAPVSDKLIERVVAERGRAIGLEDLTPHSLRASFVTLCLEAGAPLHTVQYWVGHADPRTTERYQRRKLNLDNAATDYLRF